MLRLIFKGVKTMNNYTVTNGNGDRFTVAANTIEHAFKIALEQLGGHELPITIESTGGTGERLVMPDVSKGELL